MSKGGTGGEGAGGDSDADEKLRVRSFSGALLWLFLRASDGLSLSNISLPQSPKENELK